MEEDLETWNNKRNFGATKTKNTEKRGTMRRIRLLIVLLALMSLQVYAQDMAHYKRIVKELSSARYQGRGYARGGANRAGRFLEKE